MYHQSITTSNLENHSSPSVTRRNSDGSINSLASETYHAICQRYGIKPNAAILRQFTGTDISIACKTSIDASQTFLGSHGADALCEMLILHQGIRHISLPTNGLIQSNIVSLTQAARVHASLESLDLSGNPNLSTPAAREIWDTARASSSSLVEAKVDKTSIPKEWKQRIQRQLDINRELIEVGFESNPIPRPRDQWLEVRIFLLAERQGVGDFVEKFFEQTLPLLNGAGSAWRVRFSCVVHFDDSLFTQSAETIRSHIMNCACPLNYNLPWVITLFTTEGMTAAMREFVDEYIAPIQFPELPPLYTKFGVRRDPVRKPFPSVFMLRVPYTAPAEGGGSPGSGSPSMSGGAFVSDSFQDFFSGDAISRSDNFTPPTTKAVRYFNSSRYPECASFLRLQTDMLVSLSGVFYTPKDTREINVWTDAPDAFREGIGRIASQFQWAASPSEVLKSMRAQPREVEQIYAYLTRQLTTQNAAPLLVYGSRGVGRRSVTQAALWHVANDFKVPATEDELDFSIYSVNAPGSPTSGSGGDFSFNASGNFLPSSVSTGALSKQQQEDREYYQKIASAYGMNDKNAAASGSGSNQQHQESPFAHSSSEDHFLGSSSGERGRNSSSNDNQSASMNTTTPSYNKLVNRNGGLLQIYTDSSFCHDSSINNNVANTTAAPTTTTAMDTKNNELKIVRWDMSQCNSIVQFMLFLLDVFVPDNRPIPTAAHNGNLELLMLTAQHAISHYARAQPIVLVIFDVDLLDAAWSTTINPFSWFPLSFPSTIRIISTCATESNFLSEMRSKEQQPYDVLIRGGKKSSLCRSLRKYWSLVTTSMQKQQIAVDENGDDASSGAENENGEQQQQRKGSSSFNTYNNQRKSLDSLEGSMRSQKSGTSNVSSEAAAVAVATRTKLVLAPRPFPGLDDEECEKDDFHTRPYPPSNEGPPTVAAAILTKQDSDLFLYVNLFASWVALECDDLGTDVKEVIHFVHGHAPQTVNDLIQRIIYKLASRLDSTDSIEERRTRVFNTISCLCSAPSLTSTEISRVCEQIYSCRRHSIIPLLSVMEHYGLIHKRFDGCLAPAHPVIRSAFDSYVANNGHLAFVTPQNSPMKQKSQGQQDYQYQHLQLASNSQQNNNNGNNTNTSTNKSYLKIAELDACRSAFAVIHYHAVCNLTVGFVRSFSLLADLLLHSAQPEKLVQLLGDVVLLDAIVREHATGSIYVVDAMSRAIHHLQALNHVYTIEGYTRHQFSHNISLGRLTRSLRDFLKIRSANLWQAALALQHDSTLFQEATKQFGKAPYPSLCLRNRTDAESQSLEMHVPSQNHSTDSSGDKSLRHCCFSDPFLAVTGSGGIVTLYEMTQIGGVRAQHSTHTTEVHGLNSSLRNLQQEQEEEDDDDGSGGDNKISSPSSPSPSSPSPSPTTTRHSNSAATQQQQTKTQQQQKKKKNTNTASTCFRELASFDFVSSFPHLGEILGCVVSSGLSPVALVIFVDHCCIWRFGESSRSSSYISVIENCTASVRHDVFAPGGSTFAGVAFVEQKHKIGDGPALENDDEDGDGSGDGSNVVFTSPSKSPKSLIKAENKNAAMERKVVVVDTASGKISSVVNAPPGIFVREAHHVAASGILVVEPQGLIMCRTDGTVLPMRSHHLSQSHTIRASSHSRDGGFVGCVTGVRAIMWHVGRTFAVHEEMPLHTVTASSPLLDLTFVPSGARAAIAAEDGNILLWNTITGLIHQTLKLETPDPPQYCMFTPNGRIVARTGTALRMWDVVTMQDMGGIVGHEGVINFMEASGSLLASICDCGTMKIWDLTPSFPPLTRLRGSGNPTTDLYRFGFVGAKPVRRLAVSDDASFVAVQIGVASSSPSSSSSSRHPQKNSSGGTGVVGGSGIAAAMMLQQSSNNTNLNATANSELSATGNASSSGFFDHSGSGSSNSNSNNKLEVETSLWGVDIDRSPLGKYDSTAPFIRKLPSGIISSPLFLSVPQNAFENNNNSTSNLENSNNNISPRSSSGNVNSSDDYYGLSPESDTIFIYINSQKQIVKHFCERGDSCVIGELPREVLDGTVELYQRVDGINNNSPNSNNNIGIAITSGKTLGGCRIIVYEIPITNGGLLSNDPDTNKYCQANLVAQFIGHGEPIVGIDYLPSVMISASQDRQLILWSMQSKAEKCTKVFDAPLIAFCRIFEGELGATNPGVYAVADSAGNIMVVDTSNWKINVLRRLMLPNCVMLMQPLFNSNAILLLLEGNENELFVWDTNKMKPINRIEIARSSTVTCLTMPSPQLSFAENESLLVFAGTESGVVKMYSVEG